MRDGPRVYVTMKREFVTTRMKRDAMMKRERLEER